MAKKLFLFDCDGTLLDSSRTIIDSTRCGFEAVGLEPPDVATILSVVGLSDRVGLRSIAPELDEATAESLLKARSSHVIDIRSRGVEHEPLYEGADQAIRSLAADSRAVLGIATGKKMTGLAHLLETQGWQDCFDTLQMADKAPSKPDPTMILQAMEETGIGPQDTFMIGDTSFDMEMANNAGVNAIGVTWGFHSRERLMSAHAHELVDDFPSLHTLLLGKLQ